MAKGASAATTELWRWLASQLEPSGFEAHAAKRMFVRRRAEGLYDVLELQVASGGPPEFGIHFGCWTPSLEGLPLQPGTSQARAIRHLAAACEISRVAPLKNTWWWPAQPGEADLASLGWQLRSIALPYFESIATIAEVEAIAGQQGSVSLSTDAIAGALAGALVPAGFARAGLELWRERAGVIDIVVPEGLANDRVSAFHAVVWHRDLAAGLSGDVPQGVTHATARSIGSDGVEGDPLKALWFTHGRDDAALRAIAQAVAATALPYFDGIRDRAAVEAAIPEVYRPYFARRS